MSIKSTRAEETVNELIFSEHGTFEDRMYMFVEAQPHKNTKYEVGLTAESGHFISQREDPKMTSIIATPSAESLLLHTEQDADIADLEVAKKDDIAENLIDVSVWDWNGKALDLGDEAASWGQAVLGRPVRLVAASKSDPRFVLDDPSMGIVGFADKYPLLITNIASVESVNEMLKNAGKPTVPSDRYRANIELSGLDPFEEDRIETLSYTDSNGKKLVFRRGTPCARCPIPDTDQITGEVRRDVRSVLGKNGRRGTYTDPSKAGSIAIFFGVNFYLEQMPGQGEVIKLPTGSELEIGYAEPNWIPT